MANASLSGRTLLEDEWNIDFDDTRGFLLESWKAANSTHSLSNAEKKQSTGYVNSKAFSDYVLKEQAEARQLGQHWKSTGLSSILYLVRHLASFESLIQELCDTVHDRESDNSDDVVVMENIDTSPLWQLSYLNTKLSTSSPGKFKLVSKWMSDLRRNLESLVVTIRPTNDNQTTIDENSVRMELREVFEPLMAIMHESVVYLQRHFNEEDFLRNWAKFMDSKIRDNQSSIGDTIKHLRELNANARQDQYHSKAYIPELGLRDRILPTDGAEKAVFPVEMLPRFHTGYFIGRQKDIDRIHAWLDHSEPAKIRKYHIYGRRGIGKTQLALEYSRRHKESFDAIFWIQCETKASLRQSFADIAAKLELVGSEVQVNFSESLTRVLRWLRQTQKKWLLIYDNAERFNLLRGYWPTGGQGAMLLTSRSHYNFFGDEHRQGETVMLFDDGEREELLLTLLGAKWQAEHLGHDEMLSTIEQAAIKTLLRETGGLPIAIAQATKLIKDEEINPGQTVRRFMDMFRDQFANLPRRHISERDNLIKALDTVWAITFNTLTPNAKAILQCISFLGPDRILADLFMPADQSLIPDCLAFCRSKPRVETYSTQVQNTIVQIEELQTAIEELEKKGLIRINGRAISVHRTIQEAVIFEDKSELQTRFEATVNLLYDAFPKQIEGRPLQDSWFQCREWIQHAMQIAVQYKKYNTDGATDDLPLKGEKATEMCARLLANCSWYLYEIADYDECLNLVAVARNAIFDKNSRLYAHVTNTEGAAYYEMNHLGPARAAFEICLEIRQKVLKPGHAEIALVLGNLGNVESADGNNNLALEYLEKAADMRSKLGDDAAVYLALTYMQIGRTYILQNRDTDAYQLLQKSEALLNRKGWRNKLFLGHIQYEFGNLELKQGALEQASASFEKARNFARTQGPLLPLTASANYKLGVVEFAMGHHKKALNFLNKALDIAETRNPGELDGGVIRVKWKIAEVLLDDPLGDRREEGEKLKLEAEHRRGEIADKLGINLRGLDESQDQEKTFDLLVPGYFR